MKDNIHHTPFSWMMEEERVAKKRKRKEKRSKNESEMIEEVVKKRKRKEIKSRTELEMELVDIIYHYSGELATEITGNNTPSMC